jgi:hypothetical protein
LIQEPSEIYLPVFKSRQIDFFYGEAIGVASAFWIGGSVGTISVFVGGMDVSVAGGTVFVGGMDVSVAGGTVFVGGIGVSVAGGLVFVGDGRGVLVAEGNAVLVRVGIIAVAADPGRRVGVGGRGVREAGTVAISEGRGVRETVFVGTMVAVGTNAVTACSVNAAEVLKLLIARSTMSNGSISMALRSRLLKSFIASAETLQSRLNPMTAAARTPRGPA